MKSENAQRNFNQKYNLNGFLNIQFYANVFASSLQWVTLCHVGTIYSLI